MSYDEKATTPVESERLGGVPDLKHTHDDTDETFLVLEGEMEIGFRNGAVTLKPGEMYVVPKGVEHITRAGRECHALVVEPRGVVNTGNAGGELTARNDVWA